MRQDTNTSGVLEQTGQGLQQALFSTSGRMAAPNAGRTGVLAWLRRVVPTALVLAALIGLAYWGHLTGWTIPSFAALIGRETKEKDDWCSAHAVPESQCVECNPDLLPRVKDHGWCRKHGISNCPFEHPEVAQLTQVPKITQADLDRAQRALDFVPRPENNSKCKLHQRRIQLASQQALEKAGIDVAPVWEAPVVEAVSANGEITYDQTRVARLSSRVPGTVWMVPKQLGDSARRGDVLALVDAAEVGKAKAEFLQAITQLRLRGKTLDSLRSVGAAVAAQQVRVAETAFHEAEIHLLSARQALINGQVQALRSHSSASTRESLWLG
jgi:cobalt-zinc-cadmium efflux system membrane fusion protein